MNETILSAADAAALGRVIEEGIDLLAAGPQREVALSIAYQLLTTTGAAVITTSVPEKEVGL